MPYMQSNGQAGDTRWV